MAICPSCGQENPEGFRLCGMCGASLTLAPAAREERKVVTVLFCDLVGFTAKAEQLDPEEVRAVLRPYHDRVRIELERHGGTVEKFIGDAVMALFGAPTAHEDDPERAVRAALAIREFAVEEGLELRIGITTGEALVSLGASTAEGEGMASGDVVNTAARLQSGAPVNGILVDETTYRATRATVEYDEARTIEAKGKSTPISVRRALQVRSRPGVDAVHDTRSELVGREQEVGVLRDALFRARASRTSQLVTVVGVPGIGKSRLVHELRRIVDADADLITWRQGRCLAYGDGVTLWALGEIVKAQAGIHEQDPPELAAEKIRGSVDDVLAGSADGPWVESNLLALVGLGSESELGGDRRGQAFAAWRHYFEAMAEQRPLVLVFEDLHWADESLLDFVDELVDWVSEVPLLVVGTARPELLERRPDWGGGKLNATTLALRPLSDDQTALLLARLLGRPVLAVDAQQSLLERAGGNPLYAEQFADLFLERGETDELPLPETLQGIIAARLDGLPDVEKSVLQDASVVGKVFWTTALPQASDDVAATLHALERKGFVRRQRRSSVEGEIELSFAHALMRDVAYGQIARADRADKHRHVAEWIARLGRPDDHAELLAHHYAAALELAAAAGMETAELTTGTRFALQHAGDRALALNSYAAAIAWYSQALDLWPQDDRERPHLLFRRADALYRTGDPRRETALAEARDALLALGDRSRAAEAEVLLARALWERGSADDVRIVNAEELVANEAGSVSKARVLAFSSRLRVLAEDHEAGLALAQSALGLAESLSLDELRAYALGTVGLAKLRLDDSTGVDDMELSVEIAKKANSPLAANLIHNLGVAYWDLGEVRRSSDRWSEAGRIGDRFGDAVIVRTATAHKIIEQSQTGDWDVALAKADTFIAECEAGSGHFTEGAIRSHRCCIRLARGDQSGALDDIARAVEMSRQRAEPLSLLQHLKDAAWTYAWLGERDGAENAVREWLGLAERHPSTIIFYGAQLLSPVTDLLGIAEALREVFHRAPQSPWRNAELASLDGQYERAADFYAAVGYRPWEASTRMLAAKHYFADGRSAEGTAELGKALDFYRSVGATMFVEHGEALLEDARSA